MTLSFGNEPHPTSAKAAPSPAAEAPTRKSSHLGIGIHPNIPETRYHADPCETPSASSSILKTLIERSPLHAWWDHPRLDPDFEYEASTDAQASGTILHSMILGTPAPYRVLAFNSYRTTAAKEARDLALSDHKLPILADKLGPLEKVATALRERIKADFPLIHKALHDPETLFEASVIGEVRHVLCRARLDCLPPARHGFTPDLKFTGLSAEPEAWGRKLVNDHMFQAALYPRMIEATRGDKPEFWFLVCEVDTPYGVSRTRWTHRWKTSPCARSIAPCHYGTTACVTTDGQDIRLSPLPGSAAVGIDAMGVARISGQPRDARRAIRASVRIYRWEAGHMTFSFRPAKSFTDRHGLFVSLTGGTNSGKTFSALRLARGIAGHNGKVAVLDTEGGRTLHLKDDFDFDASLMDPPFPTAFLLRSSQGGGGRQLRCFSDQLIFDGVGRHRRCAGLAGAGT